MHRQPIFFLSVFLQACLFSLPHKWLIIILLDICHIISYLFLQIDLKEAHLKQAGQAYPYVDKS
jgi:hypothetical protein